MCHEIPGLITVSWSYQSLSKLGMGLKHGMSVPRQTNNMVIRKSSNYIKCSYSTINAVSEFHYNPIIPLSAGS